MNKLYIVRHGQTDWNKLHLMQGSKDIELNENGIKQAEELHQLIDLSKLDICISSPMKRAKETAKIIVKDKLEIIYDDRIKERSFGDYEGETYDDDLILLQWNYALNDKSRNSESIKDCLLRAKIFLEDINNNYYDKSILIVSHGGFIKCLHYNLIGYDENTNFLEFFPQNGIMHEYTINKEEYKNVEKSRKKRN